VRFRTTTARGILKRMARQEIEREDLLRDATALVERIELAPLPAASSDHVVMGFRSDGAMSVYFGADPVYHFNSRGQLRRAFRAGLLFKADQGRLVSLRRVRRENEVQLVRQDLADEAQTQFLADTQARLHELVRQCAERKLVAVGQVPAAADVLGRAIDWLAQLGDVKVAESPHAR
jgi:hypothetical protein